MNSESPLVPQGSFLEQKNKGRARVRIAVFVVLAIHCVGVMALLMQGCKEKPTTDEQPNAALTNAPVAPVFTEPTNSIVSTPESNPPPTDFPSPLPVATDPIISTTQVVPMQDPMISSGTVGTPATVSEHKIVSGDTLGRLSKTYGVSAKAIQDANPGVQPTRLKLGSILRIPAPAPASLTGTDSFAAASSGKSASSSNGLTYKVKSGDNLLKIAKAHGVSTKELRAANNLKTDRIRVGQTLKIPAKANGAGAETPFTPAP